MVQSVHSPCGICYLIAHHHNAVRALWSLATLAQRLVRPISNYLKASELIYHQFQAPRPID